MVRVGRGRPVSWDSRTAVPAFKLTILRCVVFIYVNEVSGLVPRSTNFGQARARYLALKLGYLWEPPSRRVTFMDDRAAEDLPHCAMASHVRREPVERARDFMINIVGVERPCKVPWFVGRNASTNGDASVEAHRLAKTYRCKCYRTIGNLQASMFFQPGDIFHRPFFQFQVAYVSGGDRVCHTIAIVVRAFLGIQGRFCNDTRHLATGLFRVSVLLSV